MAKFPRLKAKDIIKVLLKLGYKYSHCVGSHKTFVNELGEKIVIPDHGSEEIGPGLLNKIIKKRFKNY